jgi:uncharacterized LabA/DUF88 family protein
MYNLALFVDGSNLNGSLSEMQINVQDYGNFFRFVISEAVKEWQDLGWSSARPEARLLRVYWYVVGSMDEWDLDSEKARVTLRDLFDRNVELRAPYLAQAGQDLAARPPEQRTKEAVATEAWSHCFNDIKEWFSKRHDTLNGMKRFYHGVRQSTDFIDIIEAGHWRVDMLNRRLTEKGLDASLAIGMITQSDQYDMAVVISGDADMLPSLRTCKEAGKHVGIVEFLRGFPPEDRGRSISSRLRLEADFVCRIYEMDLIRRTLAEKRIATPIAPRTGGPLPSPAT